MLGTLSMFGLTKKQTRILFSIEKLLVEKDIKNSKTKREEKEKWLIDWTSIILDYLKEIEPEEDSNLMAQKEILDEISIEYTNSINNTWYYLILLEATLFIPYTTLNKDENDDKIYKKLNYKNQNNYLKWLVRANHIIDESYIDKVEKTYIRSIKKLSNKATKILLYVVSTIAIAAITAATAGALAGPIAVMLFGSQVGNLAGAALVSACLAMAGGGAIAVGGGGMAAGVITIVGGGALLGLAGGGTLVVGINLLISSTPELTLTQAAKLQVVLKEIILNAQKDIIFAQEVLKTYKSNITNLSTHIKEQQLQRDKDHKIIKDMEKSLNYMEKAFKDMESFLTDFQGNDDQNTDRNADDQNHEEQ